MKTLYKIPKKQTHLYVVLICIILWVNFNNQVMAQNTTVLDELQFVTDIHASLLGNGMDIYFNDASIIVFDTNTNTSTSTNDIGDLDQAGIDAFHRTGDGCGDSIYSVDTSVVISGVAMKAADVFTASGIKVLDATIAGVAAGVNINAVSRLPDSCDLLISTDITALLDGIAFKADDIIRYNSMTGFSLYQTTGFNNNIDALHYLNNQRLLISTETGIALPDFDIFDDEIIELVSDVGGDSQLLAFSPQTFNDSWQAADINALWVKQAINNGIVQWQVGSLAVTEGSLAIEIIVQRTNGTDGMVDITISSDSGSAISGVDFQAVNALVSMADGQSSASVFLTLIDDTISESVEDFTLSISSVSGGASIGPQEEIEIVLTDQPAGLIQWSQSSASVDENNGTVQFVLLRTDGSEGDIDINWTAAGGSAQNNIDFIEVNSQIITLSHGQTSIFAPLTLIDDMEIENIETLKLRINSVSAQASIGAASINLVSIVDDPVGTFQWQMSSITTSEDIGMLMVTIERTNGTEGDIQVDYSSFDGSAQSGSDYVSVDSSLIISHGQLSAVVPIEILSDNNSEGPETFSLKISELSQGAALGEQDSTEITINDNGDVIFKSGFE